MLRIVNYIRRHGCPINYGSSYGEIIGKLRINNNTKRTNIQKDTLDFDISHRIFDEDIMDQISTIYY